ncbi:agmatinase [Kordiimonas sp. SCSIO 12610]|uniref:agmatinase n=1 Tax=Kordiimonas sp. SCSIO 12610 TaxID=2829597 RepID=UPI0021096307|nr:agmatinase [Kordiimonas sp. SCSIO 12610]UTW55128.1 agmatinase [Kordiimonas sp. SCSIO 12610]
MQRDVKEVVIELSQPDELYYCASSTPTIRENSLHILGFGFDGTACFRKGAIKGPNGIREVSDGIESYSPYLNADTEDQAFYDLGNLQLGNGNIEAQWQSATDDFERQFSDIDLAKNGVKLLTLGGEHSISYAPIKKYLQNYQDLVLIHLDAHADLRDGYEGYHYSHASIMRRSLDHFGPKHELIQYGIRSGTRDEYQWMNANNSLMTSRMDFLDRVSLVEPERPVYLTLDLDYFDPSFFPGTGTPEPGGEDFHSFISLMKILRGKNLVGADVVELAPDIDPTGNSSVFAAKVVRELIVTMTH